MVNFVKSQFAPDLKYKWTNLYPASYDANMMKPRNPPIGGYLDPCNPNDNVEQLLRCFINFENDAVHFEAAEQNVY